LIIKTLLLISKVEVANASVTLTSVVTEETFGTDQANEPDVVL